MNKALKIVLITIGSVLGVVVVLALTGFFFLHILIYGLPKYRISNSEKKNFREVYTLYLPDDYKFVDGYSSGAAPDMYEEYHFIVDKNDFEGMIGEKWERKEGDNYDGSIRFNGEWINVENESYCILSYAYLYYKENGDKIDCYLTIWNGYESYLNWIENNPTKESPN